ncbi:MAG: hypothetical protein K6G80_02510 [Treponema sp.]|nr:hypothetical protein [Treponema sp.]
MAHSPLISARSLLRRRSFAKAMTLLEGCEDMYRDSFDYWMTYGIACLYGRDFSYANTCFKRARKIRLMDTTLLLCQAVVFLWRGDTEQAIQYYLDVLDGDPENKIALKAMEFIRTKGNFEIIREWDASGKLKAFYPPLGVNPLTVTRILFSIVLGVGIAFGILHVTHPRPMAQGRADLSALTLTVEESRNAQEKDLSGGVYHYIMTDKQIRVSYDLARQYFQDFRDNAAQVEINRILNSNASEAIKAKTNMLCTYIEEPTFDTLHDNYSYADVASDPLLYLGCWVSWSGRITNAAQENGAFCCDLLVGYENMQRVDGIVPLYFAKAPEPEIEGDRAVTVLAQIGVENGKLMLNGRSVYQPLRK